MLLARRAGVMLSLSDLFYLTATHLDSYRWSCGTHVRKESVKARMVDWKKHNRFTFAIRTWTTSCTVEYPNWSVLKWLWHKPHLNRLQSEYTCNDEACQPVGLPQSCHYFSACIITFLPCSEMAIYFVVLLATEIFAATNRPIIRDVMYNWIM
jgi:hypothetical protein